MPKIINWNDEWLGILKKLQKTGIEIYSRLDYAKECNAFCLRIENPRDRLIWNTDRAMSLGFACREFIWYMSGSKDVQALKWYSSSIGKYSNNGWNFHGAYGPRIFNFNGINQFQKVLTLLEKDTDTRRAIIIIRDPKKDFKSSNDIPCTMLFQFLIREEKLNMITYMRSQDMMKGMVYDIFSFTLIQELMASLLGIEIGTYVHFVGSLHLYDSDKFKTEQILMNIEREKPKIKSMPRMLFSRKNLEFIKLLDTFDRKLHLVNNEEEVNNLDEVAVNALSPYWFDFWNVFLAYYNSNRDDYEKIKFYANRISYIEPFKDFLIYKYLRWKK